MKNLYRAFTTTAVVLLLVFNSCTPVDEVVVDLTPLLTNGAWRFEEVDDKDNFVKDFYEGLYDGRTIKFNASGTFSQNLPIYNTAGNWEFNSNQSILIYDVDTSATEEWQIIKLSSTELYFQVDFSGTLVKMRYTH